MKTYKYYDPGGEYIYTEEQIFDEYWEFWCSQMRKVGRENLISKERCLDDWITIHWAFEIPSKEQ